MLVLLGVGAAWSEASFTAETVYVSVAVYFCQALPCFTASEEFLGSCPSLLVSHPYSVQPLQLLNICHIEKNRT